MDRIREREEENAARPWIKPGYLSREVKADARRGEFDIKNQVIVQKQIPVDLLFIGDSMTQMWELSAYFGNSGLCILNRGIGGDRTEFLLHRFRADAVQLRPALSVVLVGINDSWELEFDDWKQEEGRPLGEVLARALENMEQVLKLAEEEHMRLAVCSALPTCMSWTNHERERQIYVKRYNEGIKMLTENYGQLYVDYYPAFVEKDGFSLKRELSVEGLHPNVFGYDLMAGILVGRLGECGIELKKSHVYFSNFDKH